MAGERGGGAEHFDVAIVGARCAGSPLATMLARRGLRVCLLDRARFPSETLSTHLIQPCGVEVLERLGLLDQVLAAGAVRLGRFSYCSDDARIHAEIDFDPPPLSLRRVALDHLLVDAAASAGAVVRTETAVTGLLREGGRVVGVESKRGPVRASLVVGADGRVSTVARLAGAREYHVAPPERLFAWAYFEGVSSAEDNHLRLASIGELAYVASPTDAGLHLAAVCPPLAGKDAFLADREGGYAAGVEAWPDLSDLLAGARRLGPIRLMTHWHGYLRQAAGPGWALLGDAGNFKDPSPAQGMADALRHAERMADVIEAGLGGEADVDEALRAWWRWRDEDVHEMHWLAADMGAADLASPIADQLIRDLAADEEGARLLMSVLNRDIRPSQLFTPSRLGTATVRAVRGQPRQLPAVAREAFRELRTEVRRSRQRRAFRVSP